MQMENVVAGAVVALTTSLMTAGFSVFLETCMEEGMIFRRYYLLLVKKWMENRKRHRRWRRVILKPLGLCVYCYNFWVSALFYAALLIHTGDDFSPWFLYQTGGSYFFLYIIKYVKNGTT